MRKRSWFVAVALLAVPAAVFAQDNSQKPPATSAMVDFGVLPTGPIGGPTSGCLQGPMGIGGPADPCSYKLHHLTPEEVTIKQGGEVTFQIHGGGHGFAIYEVSKDTTREELGQYLCAGEDPKNIPVPMQHVCNLVAANADAEHTVKDGQGKVVLVARENLTGAPGVHPDNRVWSPEDRLTSAGGFQFLNGGTVPAGPTSNGQLITYQFLKNGRYLALCINRVHFLNDWMFGFVNVTAEGGN
jgi:hypothetical protein